MFYIGLLKRIVPFFLTFAAGLFIASFFVAITPDLNWRNNQPSNRYRECKRMKVEVRELREENERLRQQITRQDTIDAMHWEDAVPPVQLEAPQPPSPPRVRHQR